MKDINMTAGREGVGFLSAVESMIKRSCIIDYGIIQKVTAQGIVEVSLAVSKTKQDMVMLTCVLANIASSSFTLDIKPNVGDRVLVVYPRLYDETMFTIPDSETDKTKIIVNPKAKGYNLTTGIAILLNQYKTASHKNLIKIEDGAVTLSLGYDEEDDENHLTLTAGADGAVEVKNDATDLTLGADGTITTSVGYDSDADKYKSVSVLNADGTITANVGYDSDADKYKSISVLNADGSAKMSFGSYDSDKSAYSGILEAKADGYISYTHKDGKTSISMSDSGMTLQDANECKIESGSSLVSGSKGIVINGKLKIKG